MSPARSPAGTRRALISRLERFASVASTQSIVSGWLDEGVPEVCVAVADEQTQGRGRQGRDWQAPPGTGLLVSMGFRPTGLELGHAWRLAALVALAMADAAEGSLAADGLEPAPGTARIRLKWPNDLVAESADGSLRKLAGVLGETVAADGQVDRAVVGIGINADWPAETFPADLAPSMTSLHELAGGRRIDRDRLLDDFLDRLARAYDALRPGADAGFDAARWATSQITTGHLLDVLAGDERLEGLAIGVDTETGGLLLESAGTVRAIDSGEVVRCRVLGVPGRL